MKVAIGSIALTLMLAACASGPDRDVTKELYDKYDAHCREHAQEMAGEADQQARYRECMHYFIGTDVECPYCVSDPHLKK